MCLRQIAVYSMNIFARVHIRLAPIDGEESNRTWKDAVDFGRPYGAQVDIGHLDPGLAPWAILYRPLTGPQGVAIPLVFEDFSEMNRLLNR